jgi:hypothetical protein
MAGLVRAIHILLAPPSKDVDARDKRGHDGVMATSPAMTVE